jgi:hypothetical protein
MEDPQLALYVSLGHNQSRYSLIIHLWQMPYVSLDARAYFDSHAEKQPSFIGIHTGI